MTLTSDDLKKIADIVRDEVTKALHPSVRMASAADDQAIKTMAARGPEAIMPLSIEPQPSTLQGEVEDITFIPLDGGEPIKLRGLRSRPEAEGPSHEG